MDALHSEDGGVYYSELVQIGLLSYNYKYFAYIEMFANDITK